MAPGAAGRQILQRMALLREHPQGPQILRIEIHSQLLADQIGAARQLLAGVAHMHERDVRALPAPDIAVDQTEGGIVQQLQVIPQGLRHPSQSNRRPPYPADLLAHALQWREAPQTGMRGAMVVPHGGIEQFLELLGRDHELQFPGPVQLALAFGRCCRFGGDSSRQAPRQRIGQGAKEALDKGPVIGLVGWPEVGSAPQCFTHDIQAGRGQVGARIVQPDLAPAGMPGLRHRL